MPRQPVGLKPRFSTDRVAGPLCEVLSPCRGPRSSRWDSIEVRSRAARGSLTEGRGNWPASLQWQKAKREHHSATRVVAKSYGSPVSPHDLHDDGKSQACPRRLATAATPEPLEKMCSVRGGNPRPTVSHADGVICAYADRDFTAWQRMGDRILDEISDCVTDCIEVRRS